MGFFFENTINLTEFVVICLQNDVVVKIPKMFFYTKKAHFQSLCIKMLVYFHSDNILVHLKGSEIDYC